MASMKTFTVSRRLTFYMLQKQTSRRTAYRTDLAPQSQVDLKRPCDMGEPPKEKDHRESDLFGQKEKSVVARQHALECHL